MEKLIEDDGVDFALYQKYFLEHYREIDVPMDADDYVPYRTEYEHLFQTAYPGKTLGVDIEFDDLNDDVKHAYLIYQQLYWIQIFEEARDSFGLTYTYYILPESETESDIYIIDGMRFSRADYIQMKADDPELFAAFDVPQGEEKEYMYLGNQVPNKRDEYAVKWVLSVRR